MKFETKQLNSAIFNALLFLADHDKDLVVEAFNNAMNHVHCEHDVCQNIGKDIADMIENQDWQELSNFIDHGHLEMTE